MSSFKTIICIAKCLSDRSESVTVPDLSVFLNGEPETKTETGNWKMKGASRESRESTMKVLRFHSLYSCPVQSKTERSNDACICLIAVDIKEFQLVWIFKYSFEATFRIENNKSIYIKTFIGTHLFGHVLLPLMWQLIFAPLSNWERGIIFITTFIEKDTIFEHFPSMILTGTKKEEII